MRCQAIPASACCVAEEAQAVLPARFHRPRRRPDAAATPHETGVRRSLVSLALMLSLGGAALAQADTGLDARLAGCLGFAPRLEDRLAICEAIAGDAALDAAARIRAARHATRIMIALQDWGGMLRSAEARLTHAPADVVAIDRKALALHFRKESRPQALAILDEAAKADPGDVDLMVTRSLALFGLGRLDEALAVADRALALAPGNPDGVRVRALLIGARGDAPAALTELDAALRQSPDNLVLLRARAQVLMILGRSADAIAIIDRIIVLFPEHRGMSQIRGLLHGELGNSAAAIADLTEAVRIDPDEAEAYENRGRIHQLSGNATLARHDYDEALRLDPRRAVSLMNRAALRADAGDFSGAAADAREAIRLDPRDVNPRITLARTVRDGDNDLPRALRLFDEALAVNPASGVANNAKGVTLLRMMRGEEAVLAFDKAIAAEPTNRLYFANRGEGYYLMERYADAMSDLNRAITLGLRNASTHYFRALVHFQQKDYASAATDIETAVVLNPRQGPTQALRAALSIRAGNPYGTIVAADRALELQPANLLALNAKAFALERLERRVEADELLQRGRAIHRQGQDIARATILDIAR